MVRKKRPSNKEIAGLLERIADLLEAQDANPFRVRAYRNGANRARDYDHSLAKLVMSGDGRSLQKIPDIGEGLAQVISRYVHNGQSEILNRLQGEAAPEALFEKVPGIGTHLAERIVENLDIHSLEALEQAAYDGRLADVEGFGPKRVQSVRVSLAGMLSRAAQRKARKRVPRGAETEPSIQTLLEVDAEYREKAQSNDLPRLTPRRFNPEQRTWLPILHTTRNGWDFTALFSNTAQAHRLNKTHDWVVIYYEKDNQEDQATVVTATHGSLEGKRIVRSREVECERYYRVEEVEQ